MDFNRLHELTFPILYVCLIMMTFVLIERLLYFAYLAISARRIGRAIAAGRPAALQTLRLPERRDLISRAVAEYMAFQATGTAPRSQVDDLSTALVLQVDAKLHARLWLLDTVITAAPLLGLLGTIFGIMQTFAALSTGGISDPGEVSRGIGTALEATALGIGTALYGILGNNALQRQAVHLLDRFKVFLLRTTY